MTLAQVTFGLALLAAYFAGLLVMLALCNISGRCSREEEAEELLRRWRGQR